VLTYQITILSILDLQIKQWASLFHIKKGQASAVLLTGSADRPPNRDRVGRHPGHFYINGQRSFFRHLNHTQRSFPPILVMIETPGFKSRLKTGQI